MIIIPAIDIIDGKCVRLTKGDYNQQKVYNENPVEVAKQFEAAGLKRLHVVDLDGAKAGKLVNLNVLEVIASATELVIDFGGGIKNINDVNSVFNAGAAMATIGSLAVKEPATIKEWITLFGKEKFFIGADVLNKKIKINGWIEDGGIDVFDFIRSMVDIGATNLFCTDISKDGMMQGAAVELYRQLINAEPSIALTASGGVTTMNDLEEVKKAGCAGAIIGKAIYEGTISLQQLSSFT
jgi:phosphoribosylformimino-5-aminoimidazole carboxamide ribotide isomerase